MADFITTQVRASKEVIDSMLILEEGAYHVDLNTMVLTPDDIYQGNVGRDEELLYGEKTWRTWNEANWGTSRNAFKTERKSGTSIYFETCGASPALALIALSKKFPDEDINVRFAGEIVQYFAEGYILKNGVKTADPKAPRTHHAHSDVDAKEHARWMRWNRKISNRKFA